MTSTLLTPVYITSQNPQVMAKLADTATYRLTELLTEFGNVVSEGQRHRLATILGRMTMMATGHPATAGRYVFDMACGRGKTTSIRAFLGTVYRLNIVDLPVIIASSRVEQLCDLKRDLIKEGVPEEDIGLFHSFKHDRETAHKVLTGQITRPDNFATEPSAYRHPAYYKVVLLTHRRVKTGKGEEGSVPSHPVDLKAPFNGVPTISQAMTYLDGDRIIKRNLMVWDEGLIASKTRTVELGALEAEYEVMQTAYVADTGSFKNTTEAIETALQWIDDCVTVIKNEKERQKDKHLPPKAIDLPELPENKRRMLTLLFSGQWKDRSSVLPLTLTFGVCLDLLRMSSYRLRLVLSNSSQAILRYDIELPNVCDRIVVLDGSYQIRTLEKIDPDLKDGYAVASGTPTASERYDNVVLHRAHMSAGRSGLLEGVQNGTYAATLADFLRTKVAPDEGCLIFLFKDRNRGSGRFDSLVRDQLAEHGIDLTAKIQTSEGEKLKYPILTWGLETATNSYSYCTHVLLPGIYHLPDHVAASLFIAQKRDLLTNVKHSDIKDVIDSEVFTAAHQAVMRVVRTWDGDQAIARHLWVFYPTDKIEEALTSIMPGLKVEPWLVSTVKLPAYALLAQEIIEYLNGLQADKISTKSLLEQFPDTTRAVRSAALDIVKADIVGWKIEGRSFIKTIVFSDETALAA